MNKDEKLSKEKGKPVLKGVIDPAELDLGESTNIEPPEEPADHAGKAYDVRTKTWVDFEVPGE